MILVGITASLTAQPETAKLVNIDPPTGAATNPRDTGINFMAGIAFQPTTGQLFGLTSFASNPANALVRINSATGVPTLVGLTGLPTVVEGDLAFNPVNGLLYGIQEVGPGGTQERLFIVNPTTGFATIVGDVPSPGDLSAMAFSPFGVLYAIDTSGTANSLLHTLDAVTAAITSTIELNANLGSGAGMTFDPATGTAYVADGGVGAQNSLFLLDPSLGILTLIGPVGVPAGIAGLAVAVVPEPTSVCYIGLGFACYALQRLATAMGSPWTPPFPVHKTQRWTTMRLRSNNINQIPTALEVRVNLGVVDTTDDYDPRTYDVLDKATWKPGYFRYEIIKAIEAGGDTITFDESKDLGGGAHFGGPIVPENTIKLDFGQILIEDKSWDQPAVSNLSIHAPKFFDVNKEYVSIARTGTAYPDPSDDNYGTDLSVIYIINSRNPLVPDAPPLTFDPYHPLYESVTLGGLSIAGGKAEDGAGVFVAGFVNLNIVNAKIWNNNASRLNEQNGTLGAGLYAGALSVQGNPPLPTEQQPQAPGDAIAFGPFVTLTNSLVVTNSTSVNDDPFGPSPIDQGGGIYTGPNCSLAIIDSMVSGNVSENGGGGIDCSGGIFYGNPQTRWDEEDLRVVRVPGSPAPLHSTTLTIKSSVIANNVNISSLAKADVGGGLVVRDATGAKIADSTFFHNEAGRKGAEILLSGLGGKSSQGNEPYYALVGQVVVVSCTFQENMVGYTPPSGDNPPTYGAGGGVCIEGGANNHLLVNSTVSTNLAI